MDDSDRISPKLRKFRPSATLLLKAVANERRREGQPVFDFGLGETKGSLAAHVREAFLKAVSTEQTMYADPAGIPELRAAVLSWLGLERSGYDIGNVIITNGAKQSLFNIFLALCSPADCVLFDAAPWVSYQPLAAASYAFPVMVIPRAGASNRLKVTADDLRRNLDLRPHSKLFLLNNPVNPTGQLYSGDEVDALLSVCVERRVFFVLDRLYWKLVFDGRGFPEPRVDDETRPWLIQVDGMSKNFRRAGGLRIGWSVAPTDVARAMSNLQSHYTSGPSTPAQHASLAAIARPYQDGLRDELESNRSLLVRLAPPPPRVVVWPTPASFYSFWDVTGCFGLSTPDGRRIRSADDVAAWLAHSTGVITASGTAFEQEGYLRLSFAVAPDELQEGMAAARHAIEALA